MDLPAKLDSIFQLLSRGKHISIEEGEAWQLLNNSIAEYQEVFRALGFELVSDSRGYFYFHGSNRGLSDGTEKLALFVYVLVDWLADNGDNIIESLFTKEFEANALPHLSNDRYKGYMSQVSVSDQKDLNLIIKNMSNLGFAKIVEQESLKFRFLSPIWRMLETCLKNNLDVNEQPVIDGGNDAISGS
jgi:chromosome condensin MukBEF MukE localization factor